MKETTRLFVDGSWGLAPSARPGSGACIWIDIELDQAGDAETALTADWLARDQALGRGQAADTMTTRLMLLTAYE